MISWEYSLEGLDKELELTNKKKEALDNLFNAGRISQVTYENLNTELTGTITEIENRRKALAHKMTSKINELQQQITMLESFLASSEIRHAAGEVDDESYARESNVLTLGLEATKQELKEFEEAVGELVPKEAMPTPPKPTEAVKAPPTEEVIEKPPEIPVEAPVEAPVAAPMEAPVEVPVEAEAVSEEAEIERPIEVISAEAPGEGVEALVEEKFRSSEGVVEETVATSESTVETVVEEAPAEEEVGAPAEEKSPFQGEEEATTEEEKNKEQP